MESVTQVGALLVKEVPHLLFGGVGLVFLPILLNRSKEEIPQRRRLMARLMGTAIVGAGETDGHDGDPPRLTVFGSGASFHDSHSITRSMILL